MFHTKFPAFNINYQMRQDTRPNNYKPKKKARQQRDTEVWILKQVRIIVQEIGWQRFSIEYQKLKKESNGYLRTEKKIAKIKKSIMI